MSETVEHQADGGEGDHGLGDLREFLVILGEAPLASQPSKRSLNHPTARQNNETDGSSDAVNDDQSETKQETGEEHRKSIVGAVGEDGAKPTVERLDFLQQRPRAVGVLDIGGEDDDAQQQAGGVDRYVAFAPPDFLARIVPTRPPFSVVWTLWLSMMAAVGLASRPSASRSMTRRW